MTVFIITFCVFVFFLIFMSIGVIMAHKPLKGSCGGLGKIMGKDCEFCDKKENCRRAATN